MSLREIDLVGQPKRRTLWLGRILVRDCQILFWLCVAAVRLPFFWLRGRRADGALGEAVALLFQRLGATFIKVGQIVSTRPDIFPPGFLAPLVRLQDRVPPFAFADVRAAIAEEFGRPIEEIFAEFSLAPVASASVSQVHRGVLRDPPGLVVAVKVRRPGIVRRAYLDEAILRGAARLASIVPTVALLNPEEAVNHFCQAVNLQLDFRVEARNNRRFRANFAGDDRVVFPALVEQLCTDRVLTMEFVDGVKDDRLAEIDADPRALSHKGIDIICRMIYHHGFVHADLHPGNILFLRGNRVALIDLGLVAELDDGGRNAMARLNYFMLTGMGTELARMIYDESPVKNVRDYAAFERDVGDFVSRVHGRPLQDLQITALIGELFNILRRHRIHAAAGFTVVNIAMMVMEGLGRKLNPALDLSTEAVPYLQSALGLPSTGSGQAPAVTSSS